MNQIGSPPADSAQILVVDDTPTNLRLLTEILASEGYRVRPAAGGRLALRSVAVEPPDLILLDVKMPDMSGYEVCDSLKSDKRTRNIPVIFVSALGEAEDIVTGFRVGGVDYITKPFQPLEVVARVKTHLSLRLLQKWLEERNTLLQREITERIRTEKALRASEERMRLLIDSSPLGVALVRDGRYVYSNPALTRFCGFDNQEELIGLPMTQCIDPVDHETVVGSQEEISTGRTPFVSAEVKGLKKDGRPFDITLWQTGIGLPEGPAVLVFAADTSEDKILRAQLLQAQKMEAVATLAGGIAHEFNNLLTIISGYSELLLADRTEDQSDYADIEKIVSACRRGADLVDRLSAFGKRSEYRMKIVDINREIAQTAELLYRTIPRMIDIELVLADELEMIEADTAQVGQILINLALNAKDAMPEGGRLTFETQNVCLNQQHCQKLVGAQPGDYVQLTVSDTGHGMDKQTLERIFEPFYTTRGLAQRSGLGLAMVYSIVEGHKGYITCDSEIDEGTKFSMYFPAVTDGRVDGIQPELEEPRTGNETILLVDDEENIRDLGERILRRAGYNVLTAVDGESALALYEKEGQTISLVILDLIMPGMGGERCLGELLDLNPDVKVIISSGVSAEERSKKTIEDRTQGLVGKPYHVKELLRVVRRSLDG